MIIHCVSIKGGSSIDIKAVNKLPVLLHSTMSCYRFTMALYATIFLFSLNCFIMMNLAVDASPLPDNSTALSPQVCNSKALLKNIENVVNKASTQHIGNIPAYSASSCKQIADLRPETESGYYWIQEDSGPVRVYCHMGDAPCGEGVWMRVANVNMTKTSSSCPAGLEKVTSPKSLCRKRVNLGCSSAKFFTHAVSFSKVCGRVIGIQYYSTDAFHPYYTNQGRTIDDSYVDGVSITHSSSPRQHIWTFAAALDEVPGHNLYACPCTNSKSHVAYTGLIPQFIGNNFFCETGSRTTYTNRYYVEDPLWDGKGCGRFSTCCEGERKPWFHKDLFQNVTSDVEVRVCADQARSNEDVMIQNIDLFVQ